MNIMEISVMSNPDKMKVEVSRLAHKRKCSEDDIWILIDGFRRIHEEGKRPHIAGKIGDVLTKILSRVKVVTESWIEDRLKYELERRNISFKTQIKIGRHRVDFLFPQANLIVEADGKKYHSTYEQRGSDFKRELYLISKGYTVIRFTGSELYTDVDKCVEKIERMLPY